MDWELLKDVSEKKENIIKRDPERIKDWNPYAVNMVLSLHKDAILFVNEVNCRPKITPMQHYKYLFYALPKARRFAKKAKPKRMEKLEVIRAYYDYNMTRALEVVDLLSDDDIKVMKQKLYKGGQK